MTENKPMQDIFNYLYLKDKPQKADLVIGFGHFDMNIPRRCAQLFLDGYAKKIILTGGVGAGTADLDKPEAQAFTEVIQEEFPQINRINIIVEDKSTNTSENILFSQELLKAENAGLKPEGNSTKAIIVASPSRQRRVWLTCKKHFPNVQYINLPVVSDFEKETELFRSKDRAFEERLIGEIYRIINYPARGLIAGDSIPKHILQAYNTLQKDNGF